MELTEEEVRLSAFADGVGEFLAVPPWIRMCPLRAARELKLCNHQRSQNYTIHRPILTAEQSANSQMKLRVSWRGIGEPLSTIYEKTCTGGGD